MASKRKIAETGAFVGSCFPRWKPDKATLMAWEKVLADVPDDVLEAAALDYCSRDTEWPPSAGQLRHTAFALRDQAQGVPDVDQAVTMVLQVVKDALPAVYGQPVEYPHPIIRELIHAAGGLEKLKMSENWTADRARIIELYGVVRTRYNAQTRMLPGVSDVVRQLAAKLDAKRLEAGDDL